MDTKLTLRLDKEVIEQIKIYALKDNLSVSALTEDLYKKILMEKEERKKGLASAIARKYKGILGKEEVDLKSVRLDSLKKKHIK